VGLNRYYVPNLPQAGEIKLTPEEANHAVRVRREEVGASCILFDGLGHEATATFVRTGKHEAVLHVDSFQFDPKVLPGNITLGVAMPKGDRQKDVIEKAVELGVHRLVPMLTQRSVSISEESHLEKWRRYVIESCKQCERNQLIEIDPPKLFIDLINDSEIRSIRLIAHPTPLAVGSSSLEVTSNVGDEVSQSSNPHFENISNAESIFIVIGPEGGFTDQEVQLAFEHNWKRLDLGPRILRVETAVSMASVLAGLMVQGQLSETRRLPEKNDHA
jgi:16S rRNA (uracil1498-N3)-methyltransferase